jgi:D-glycero-D-manno-heptose 1,7-bisphosphate phosphatase
VTEDGIIADDAGLWRQSFGDASAFSGARHAALFLDRDGVVLEEVNYLHRVADMRLIAAAAAVIRTANDYNIPVILVTNQSGVGRGYYGWPEFAAIQAALVNQLAAENARLDMVLACAYHADAKSPFDVAAHPWRKPRPGMLHAAEKALGLDLSRSWIVGDTASDIEAGKRAGLAGCVHVGTGHGPRDEAAARTFTDDTFEVLSDADIGGAGQILPRMRNSWIKSDI